MNVCPLIFLCPCVSLWARKGHTSPGAMRWKLRARCVCVCVCVHRYIYICVYIYYYTYIYIYIYMYTYVYTHGRVNMYEHVGLGPAQNLGGHQLQERWGIKSLGSVLMLREGHLHTLCRCDLFPPPTSTWNRSLMLFGHSDIEQVWNSLRGGFQPLLTGCTILPVN